MSTRPTLEELVHRIQVDVDHFSGALPERAALCWYGYIGALLEWGLVSVSDHDALTAMLPRIEANPVVEIFLGRDPA